MAVGCTALWSRHPGPSGVVSSFHMQMQESIQLRLPVRESRGIGYLRGQRRHIAARTPAIGTATSLVQLPSLSLFAGRNVSPCPAKHFVTARWVTLQGPQSALNSLARAPADSDTRPNPSPAKPTLAMATLGTPNHVRFHTTGVTSFAMVVQNNFILQHRPMHMLHFVVFSMTWAASARCRARRCW
ncbi:hypothetical protein COCMIDRAFT_22996 [Bipolaris oryzae ATCC 44560]|uniref:Uncharacterized protein n=1 Tax=Bipolaris oryzae ATCC 44560 TaxID=930090 RepID=W6ZC90_COCMI|nr:uncharacterized protein COCMIDRAFT_22996 [Bipolaris oryzae ATCC 44560]EUC49417.1 hypothetical protein COCMIDRAFT_22996 [Bipolaris oryzae ATCC 44560]